MKAETGVTIVNSVAIICFSILAYVFGKWWIVLFALLFYMKTTNSEGDET